DELLRLGGDIRELEKPFDLLADLPLAALDGVLGVDLVSPQVGHALDCGVLTQDVLSEEARKAVHRVRRREYRPSPLPSRPERGCTGKDRLAHAALAAKEDVLQARMLGDVLSH